MRKLVGRSLIVLAVALVLFVLLALVGGLAIDHDPGVLAVLPVLAVPVGLLAAGRSVLSGPRRTTRPRGAAAGPRDAARYVQRCCQVPVKGSLVALVWAVGALWASVALVTGLLQSLLIIVGVLPVAYLLGVVIYLPYAIRVGAHTLTVGVLGVPRFGRGWRRVTMPLTEVLEWRVLPGLKDPAMPRFTNPGTGKAAFNSGNMCGPGPNHVLVVRYDPRVVSIPFPAVVMQGYGTTTPGRLGVADRGALVVLTNRPGRLRRALEAAAGPEGQGSDQRT